MSGPAYELVTRRLSEVTGWTPPTERGDWLCPAHGDNNPSLSVTNGDGSVLLCCHANCTVDAVLLALDLTKRDLFDEPREMPTAAKPKITANYPYTDEDDQLLFEVVRFDPKDFRQRRPIGDDQWEWRLGDTRRVLYRLPRVIDAVKNGETVWIVEGEKDVEALERAGEVATCSPGGAGKWKAEYSTVLEGAGEVIVVRDKDPAGVKHSADVEASLVGKVAHLLVVEARTGKDTADHLGAGHSLDEFEVVGQWPEPAVDGPTAQAALLRSRLLTVDQVKNLPPPEPLIDRVLSRRKLAFLWGRPGSGKSFVALDWALSIATGSYWFGHAVTPGLVVYLAAEGADGIGQRLDAWQTDRQVYDIPGDQFLLLPDAVNLLDTGWAAALAEVAGDLRPTLIVADTLARSMVGGEENSSRDAGIVIAAANKIQQGSDTTLLFVHHDTREGSNLRGSSGFDGAADTSIECRADGQAITLKSRKQKDMADFPDLKLWRQPTGNSCVLYSQHHLGVTELGNDSQKQLLQVARESIDSNGLTSGELLKASGLTEATYYRCRKALVDAGELRVDKKRYYLTGDTP